MSHQKALTPLHAHRGNTVSSLLYPPPQSLASFRSMRTHDNLLLSIPCFRYFQKYINLQLSQKIPMKNRLRICRMIIISQVCRVTFLSRKLQKNSASHRAECMNTLKMDASPLYGRPM